MTDRFHLAYIMVGADRTILALDTRDTRELIRWAQWFEHADRQIALTEVGECEVSTVFLSIDHGFYGAGPPILFETMVFSTNRAESDLYQERYATLQEAKEGHQRVVEYVRQQVTQANATAADIIGRLCKERHQP